ncbi:hypothetical protein RI103_36170 [Paraburkholderia sp. FT54]|uniref:hypothetical protein n=1 Tax=Paraburkholderia sp. FT54 TaxID=3074437 RepID=UPI00287738A2|nr:hypothetical protein [Paraburkholderia sp. FT54]WNC94579.1 hypothetical protein RI103_36170 [Paraburkholderia sp. FT54]
MRQQRETVERLAPGCARFDDDPRGKRTQRAGEHGRARGAEFFWDAMNMREGGTVDSIRFTAYSNPSVVLNPTHGFIARQVYSGCATIVTQLAPV